MQEQLTHWEPVAGLAPNHYVVSIVKNVDEEEFKVILTEQFNVTNEVHVSFKRVYSYRHTNESFRLNTIHQFGQRYGEEFYYWTFFKINNSDYIKWLSEESCGASDEYGFIHFSLKGADSILDIIAIDEPKITFHKYRSE